MADFSDVFKQTGSLCRFSPDGAYIAVVLEHRLFIRSTDNLQIVALYKCIDAIQDVGWAPDSDHIFCVSFRMSTIQVFSLSDEAWTAQIDEGLGGCVAVRWTPDGRHLLSFSEFRLRITIWSLCTKDAMYIQHPKFTDKGFCFRSDNKYFALAERIDTKDHISIYDCTDWTLLKRWPIGTNDLDGISWSPDGRFIVAWEPSIEYAVHVYHPDGRFVSKYSAYDTGLGIKTLCWAPSSQFLAIGSYDQKCRLLNYYTWKPLIELAHPTNLPYQDIAVYKEVDFAEDREAFKWSALDMARPRFVYKTVTPPITIPQIKSDPEKPNPRIGVGLVEFSCTGHLLATKNDNMPNTLWIWSLTDLHQTALIQQLNPIRIVRWNPVIPDRLAFTCGTSFIYVWQNGLGCESVEVPALQFQIMQFEWSRDGKSLVLMDKDKFCMANIIDE